MIKKLLNTPVLRTMAAIVMLCLGAAHVSFGQVAGDYGSRNATGVWGTTTDWLIFVSAADWSDATVAAAVPPSTKNVYIRVGHNMTVSATGSCKNLIVDGTLTANASVRVYGPTMSVNGTVTGNTSGILEVATLVSTDSLTIGGSGSFSVGRIRPYASATVALNAILNMNINLMATGAAGLGANVYANGFRVRIPINKTVTTANTSYVSAGATGSNDPATPGTNFTVEVEGTLNVGTDATNAATTNFNLRNFASTKTSTLIVRSTGTVNIAGNLLAPSAGMGTSALTVESGGKLNFIGYNNAVNGSCDLSKATTNIAGTIDFNASSTASRSLGTANVTGTLRMKDNVFPAGTLTLGATAVAEYYGATATLPATPTTYPNLTINNPSGATLSASTTVSGILTLTTGTLSLGANTLTVAGSVTKTSGNIDASASTATFTNTSPITLPVGAYTGSVNALTINGTGGITLSEALTVTNALTLTSGNITLGANDLTVGSTSGGSTTSHVFTNSTGYLKSTFVGGDTKTFPIGATASSYDPFVATPTSATTFGARVSTIDPTHTLLPTVLAGSREWDLTSTAPSSTVLAFTPGDGRTAPTGVVKLRHWNGTTWDADIAATYSGGTFTGTASAFSPFIAAELTAPLSIELQNLAVRGNGTTNVVFWSTANEKDNAAFNIERSADGHNFATIGTIKGNGTTSNLSNYDFTDNAPLNGINYYRLRAVDTDGKATISKSVSIVNGKIASGILKAYPSVSNAILTVDVVTEGVATLNIIDLTGKTVLTKTIKDNGFSSNPMDVSGLSNGMYVLMFKSASVQTVQKFIKN